MISDVPDLYHICLEILVDNATGLTTVALLSLPDTVLTSLFEGIVASGKLTPRLLQAFEDVGSESIDLRIKELGISKWTPPLIADTRDRWLGRRPPLW